MAILISILFLETKIPLKSDRSLFKQTEPPLLPLTNGLKMLAAQDKNLPLFIAALNHKRKNLRNEFGVLLELRLSGFSRGFAGFSDTLYSCDQGVLTILVKR